ncbi:MAG: hypothetical protein OXM55_00245, partial [Bdellovibrionales bacterium]|nr:hypothetical protein [Bdellovibrionales bacterium]
YEEYIGSIAVTHRLRRSLVGFNWVVRAKILVDHFSFSLEKKAMSFLFWLRKWIFFVFIPLN